MGALNINRIKVNSLTHSAGTITAVINGATYTVSVGSVTANNRYFIYFVPTTGLVISQLVNSAGPAGAASWFLVGAFYANETPAFGAFVNITGRPTFSGANNVINYTPTYTNLTVSSTDFFSWALDGECALILGRYTKSGGAAGICSISLPVNLAVANRISTQVCVGQHAFAVASASDGGIAVVAAGTVMFPSFSGGSFSGKLTSIAGTLPGNSAYGVDARVPIQGFTNTQLVDL